MEENIHLHGAPATGAIVGAAGFGGVKRVEEADREQKGDTDD